MFASILNSSLRSAFVGVILAGFCMGLLAAGCGDDRGNRSSPVPFNAGQQNQSQNQSEAASCDDGVLNGNETDIDCGGSDCDPCDQGRSCEANTDCLTGQCDRGTCVDAQCVGMDCLAGQSCYRGDCFRGCRNQVDCPNEGERCFGGACLPLDCNGVSCEEGTESCYLGGCYEHCDTAADCAAEDAQCLQNACVTPSCSDGIQSGQETDVDCGGSVCGPCGQGQNCLVNTDCLSDFGEWSDCEFPEDVCANVGIQYREVADFECGVGNVCTGTSETESRECTRDTDGITCYESDAGEWSQCLSTGIDECSRAGEQVRSGYIYQCESGYCAESYGEESQACEIDTTGSYCDDGLSCTAAQCGATGSCDDVTILDGLCAIDGGCYGDTDVNPDNECQVCDPYESQTEWTSVCTGAQISETSTPGLAIPDNNLTGVTDTITTSNCPIIEEITVDLHITHTYRGDLRVELTSPSGQTATLHHHEGGGADDIIATYPNPSGTGLNSGSELLALHGTLGTGQWELSVVDNVAGDVGTLVSWTINLTCQ